MADWLSGYFENKKIVDNTVNPAGGGAAIADGAVTNAKLAAAAANTLKTNATALSAAPSDLAVAINTIVGRGATGNIDDLGVLAGLTITDTTIGRPALTGDVTAAANSNALAIATNAVVTAHILDANITTAKVALNAVGNARMAKMAANTLKGNATAVLADSGDITLSGGLSMDGASVIKSKTGFAFNLLFDNDTVSTTDPGATYFRFNAAGTVMYISSSALGGRSLDAYFNLSNRGAFCFMSNNVASQAWGIFQANSIASDLGIYFTVPGSLLASGGTLPADNEECVIYYNPVSSAADVDAINKTNLYLRRNTLNQIINESGVVISGTPVVANQAALPSVVDYDGFGYRVDNQGAYGIDYQSEGTVWSPTNGLALIHIGNSPIPIITNHTTEGYLTWPATTFTSAAATNAVPGIRLTSLGAHGFTSAVAVGKKIYISAGTNWTAGFYTIKTIATDTTGLIVDLEETFVAGMGVPTISLAGTEVTLVTKTIPALRANSSIHVNVDTSSTFAASTTRTTNIKLGATVFCSHGNTSTGGSGAAISCKINNQGSAAVQLGSMPLNHNGYVTSGATVNPVSGTINTAAETTLTITADCATANTNVAYKITHYEILIRG